MTATIKPYATWTDGKQIEPGTFLFYVVEDVDPDAPGVTDVRFVEVAASSPGQVRLVRAPIGLHVQSNRTRIAIEVARNVFAPSAAAAVLLYQARQAFMIGSLERALETAEVHSKWTVSQDAANAIKRATARVALLMTKPARL